MQTLNEIRATFLNYFARNGHEVVESSPLVPRNDPTLMFANSGMVQFKNLFTGVERRDYVRATTAQKCVRAGGKHNDLDNVGHTARHHTFFEMLGNFSFGDYFKDDAIAFAWEFVTRELGIDAKRLLVTVYHEDDEAFGIWRKIGVPESGIIRIATSDNFWQMGPTGPCGPCTEIFYDHGDGVPGGPPGSPEEDGDRFIEIWNLVFMQNELSADGTMTSLEMQSIDTGMGLERVGALLQGSHDNYDTDLFKALIEASADVTGTEPYGEGNVKHRVIADHLRSSAFLVADGVLPSKEGRGYVLRRIMRRAMRQASQLGAKDPVMHKLVPVLVQKMGAAYPELVRARKLVEDTLLREETGFRVTLDRGLGLLEEEVGKLPEGADLSGEVAFKLYDTYGFPLDLTRDALREVGRDVDEDGFEAAMAEQRARARAAWGGTGDEAESAVWFDVAEESGVTDFLGYDTDSAEGRVVAVVVDGARTAEAGAGTKVGVALNQTPFYAESGGQVGDTGEIKTPGGRIRVDDTRRVAGVTVHVGEVVDGKLAEGESALLAIDGSRRGAIRANHSATHLLHEALRSALGDHVSQRGSLNDADRLRFDFSHPEALDAETIARVEDEVGAHVRADAPVETRIMSPDDARELGAQALFGEKYGDEVRVVSMGRQPGSGKGSDGDAYSLELCGGTHVSRTGEIGTFVILGDSASSAGVRRVEALTGAAADRHNRAVREAVAQATWEFKCSANELVERVKAERARCRELTDEVGRLRRDMALGSASAGDGDREVGGVKLVVRKLDSVGGKELPPIVDGLKESMGSGVALVIASDGGKAAVAAGVTPDLVERVSAVDVVRAATAELGGKGGGGRPDLAQGGGASAENADVAIAAVERLLGEGA